MSLPSDHDAKERVRDATDIVDLIGNYLRLDQRGRRYVGLCPFHDDSRPSFTVDPERQLFKCWACGVHGDVFAFVMKRESIDFPAGAGIFGRSCRHRLEGTQRTEGRSVAVEETAI